MPKKGYKQTEEHKKNSGNAQRGKKMSLEARKKMSKSHLGKKLSLKTRAKMSLIRAGRKLSDAHKKSLSKAKLGKKNPNYKHGKCNTLEMINHYSRMRKARVRGADGNFTLAEWENLLAQYNWTCPCCGKEEDLTVDHIIPISKGGSNNIENIQPLCGRCNRVKHTKIIKYEF